jgi:phage terminase large subunit GpA-like protein
MLPQWTLHLKDHEEKKRFRRYIYSSKGVLDRLRELIEQEEANISRKEYSEGSYDNPSWAALQAHRNGKREALNFVKHLLTFDPKDENEPS